MFRARIAQRTALFIATTWLVVGSSASWALSSSLDISQYGHRAWRNLNGFELGSVSAIAQTTDGYMWLATPTDLLRFDGVRSVPLRSVAGISLDEGVRALRGGRDGTLWIGTNRGLFGIKTGSSTVKTALPGMTVNAIDEDSSGTVWVAGAMGGKGLLCAIRQAGDECHGQDGQLGSEIVALHRDSANALWVLGGDRAWKWASDPLESVALPDATQALRSMTQTADGAIVIGLRGQVVAVSDGKIGKLPLPSWTRDLAFDKVLRDRGGSLWLGAADSGLIRLHAGRVDTYATQNGLSGDKILDLFEDREGNVWVSTSRGLDQFRPIAAAIQSGINGLKGRSRAVLSARDGSVWASTTTGIYQRDSSNTWMPRRTWLAGVSGLYEDHHGMIWAPSRDGVQYYDGQHFVDAIGIPAGPIDAMIDDANGGLWLAHRDQGLLRVQTDGKAKFSTEVVMRLSSRVSALAVDPADRSLWVGLWSGGLENLRDGQVVRRLALVDGVTAPSPVNHIRAEGDGTLWVSSFTGLHRVAHGQVARLNVDSGLPCDRLFSSFADGKSLWIEAQCGLIRIDRQEADAWVAAAANGIRKRVASQLLDSWDGVTQGIVGGPIGYTTIVYNFSPKIARSTEGALWVVAGDSLVTIDPQRLLANDPPPPVHIELLASDGKSYESPSVLRLPPLQHNLEIEYTALSFASLERVQFRYKLDGRDAEWQDAGNRRKAFYTDLAPGHYRFSVTAATATGVWNREGDSLEFSIEPAWWQTLSFRVACVVFLALVLYGLYKLRIARLSRQFNAALEARINERLRIARDLHDTLLQSFQGLVLRLQTAFQLWPSVDARRILAESIDSAEAAMTEGRDAVQGLRSATESNDLASAIRALGEVLATDPGSHTAKFSVAVQGRPRALHPIVRDDVFRIVGEALRNSFRHAQPKHVEVDIRYGDRDLSVLVRDDGKGMDSTVVRGGREGHFGLHGMRERAKLIGGMLTLRSRRDAGTEVELVVPSKLAHAVSHINATPRDSVMGQGADTSST